MTDLRPIEPHGDTGLPRTYLPLGRTVRLLRAQIEAATGASLTFRSPGPPALWSATAADGKAVLRVAPGPLLSPYDTPETGLSSLRLSYAGRPLGGEPPPRISAIYCAHAASPASTASPARFRMEPPISSQDRRGLPSP